MKTKKMFYSLIHLFFISGLLYAFNHFIRTPRSEMFTRRLWAYENWIIFSMYTLFIFLTLMEKEIRLKNPIKIKQFFIQFKKILAVNLILLILPWGLFLLLAPIELLTTLRLKTIYWKILGTASLLGALIYYLPYRFYRHKLSYYILIFGAVDNFLAGTVVTYLFIKHNIPLFAFASTPLLFYFSYFFYDQVKKYSEVTSAKIKLNS